MRPPESFIEQPIRSLQTMLRIIAEDDNHLPTVVPDGIYGSETEVVVSAFQRREGLPDTGITDQLTWDQIVKAYEAALIRVGKAQPIEIIMDSGKIYKLGETGPYIYLLQSILIQLSQDHPTITAPNHNGILDTATSQAISAFQALADLPVTGELDKITWKNIALQYALHVHHIQAR